MSDFCIEWRKAPVIYSYIVKIYTQLLYKRKNGHYFPENIHRHKPHFDILTYVKQVWETFQKKSEIYLAIEHRFNVFARYTYDDSSTDVNLFFIGALLICMFKNTFSCNKMFHKWLNVNSKRSWVHCAPEVDILMSPVWKIGIHLWLNDC